MYSQKSKIQEDSRFDGSIITKVACAVKDKMVGWAKDIIYGS